MLYKCIFSLILFIFLFSQQSSAGLLSTTKSLNFIPRPPHKIIKKFLKVSVYKTTVLERATYPIMLPYLFFERATSQMSQEYNVLQEAYIQRLWGYYIFDEDLFSKAEAVLEEARLLANRIAYEKFGVRKKSKGGKNIYYGIPKGHIKFNTRYHVEARVFNGKGYYLLPVDFLILENNVENIAWALLNLIIKDQLRDSVVQKHYNLDMYGRKNAWYRGPPVAHTNFQDLPKDTDKDGVREYHEGRLYMTDYRNQYVALLMGKGELDYPRLRTLHKGHEQYKETVWPYGESHEKWMRAFKQFYMVNGSILYRSVETHLQKSFQSVDLFVPCGVPQINALFLNLDECQALPISENLKGFIDWTSQKVEKINTKITGLKGLAFTNTLASFVLASYVVSKVPFLKSIRVKGKGFLQAVKRRRVGKATKSVLMKGIFGTVFVGSIVGSSMAIEMPGLELILLSEGQLKQHLAFYEEIRTIFNIVNDMDPKENPEEYLLGEMQRVMEQFGSQTTRFIKNVTVDINP